MSSNSENDEEATSSSECEDISSDESIPSDWNDQMLYSIVEAPFDDCLPMNELGVDDCLSPSIMHALNDDEADEGCEVGNDEDEITSPIYSSGSLAPYVYGSAPNECSYKDGYMKRQNLYYCVDCSKDYKNVAGICVSCARLCHKDHTVHEMYTKRDFRCDCGNNKFGSFSCKLWPEKDLFNEKNAYDDNFRGIYCICKKAYDPNPVEDADEGDMIQCVVCEDWYHFNHLDVTPPRTLSGETDFSELICFLCCNKYAYLTKYQLFTNKEVVKQKINEKSKMSSSEDNKTISECTVKNITFKLPYTSLFLQYGWRKLLCRCSHCMETYKLYNHSFLIDDSDVVKPFTSKIIDCISEVISSTSAAFESSTVDDPASQNQNTITTQNPNDLSIDSKEMTHSAHSHAFSEQATLNSFLKKIQQKLKKARFKVFTETDEFQEYLHKKHPKFDDNQH